MSVLVETSKGDLVIDLHVDQAPIACRNFLKLCKAKYYNHCLVHLVQKGRLFQTGDPSGTGQGGTSVFGLVDGEHRRFFPDEFRKQLRHDQAGTVSMANAGPDTNASQFFVTTSPGLSHLDDKHSVFGKVAEGMDTVAAIDDAYCDADGRPFQNIRIRHTIILEDPFDDPQGLVVPDQSPSPTAEQIQQDAERLADDERVDDFEGKTAEEVQEAVATQAAKSQAEVLEMLGDLPDADIAPPENVLFVCKLNPITQDEDLEIIFSRFGGIKQCEVIRDRKTGESLNYAFVEFDTKEQCEMAYLKMDGVLVDDRRIKVDFSQSVSRMWNKYRRNDEMSRLPDSTALSFGAKDFGRSADGRSRGRGGRNESHYAPVVLKPHARSQEYGADMVFDTGPSRAAEVPGAEKVPQAPRPPLTSAPKPTGPAIGSKRSRWADRTGQAEDRVWKPRRCHGAAGEGAGDGNDEFRDNVRESVQHGADSIDECRSRHGSERQDRQSDKHCEKDRHRDRDQESRHHRDSRRHGRKDRRKDKDGHRIRDLDAEGGRDLGRDVDRECNSSDPRGDATKIEHRSHRYDEHRHLRRRDAYNYGKDRHRHNPPSR